MATMQDRRQVTNEAYYDEPATKPPPMLAVGPLAWMRENLFGSTMDTILTVIGTVIIVGVITSFLQWAISAANWFSVTYNLRLFMVGRVEPFMEPRLLLLASLITVMVGMNLATWTRVNIRVWIVLALVVALTFVLPAVIYAVVPLSPTYLGAGQTEITSGSISESPRSLTGFIAREGDTLAIRYAGTTNDVELAQINGFTDSSVDAIRNAADNRLEAQERIVEIEALLAGDTLTPRQREALQAELESLEVPEPISETFAINTEPVTVSILDGETLEPLVTETLDTSSPPLTFTIPESGWYALEQTIPGSDASIGVLAAEGIYPIFERNYLRSTVREDGSASTARVFEYERSTDNFRVVGGRPRIDNEEIPAIGIIAHQYKGERTFTDYLRLMLAPFMSKINVALALFLGLTVAGYYGTRLVDRQFSPAEKPRAVSRRIVTWLWAALPVIAFILIAGIGESGPLRASDPQLWGGFLLTMMLTAVGIVAAFPIGIALALGRRSSLPVVSVASTLYIEVVRGVPLITVLFMSMLLVPFVAPWLGGPDTAPYRAMVAVTFFSAAYLAENVRGGLQSLPPGQEEAAKALGLAGWQVTLFITLPQALRAVIPALVGQFISLFKDTSLVAIVGLIDLTGVATGIAAQTEFQGLRRETYVFISIIYFVFSYVMSIVSRRIEASGSGAARRV